MSVGGLRNGEIHCTFSWMVLLLRVPSSAIMPLFGQQNSHLTCKNTNSIVVKGSLPKVVAQYRE